MNWKQVFYKLGKGATTGALVAMGALLKTGMPLTQHGWVVAGGTVVSAAIHAAINVGEQLLGAL